METEVIDLKIKLFISTTDFWKKLVSENNLLVYTLSVQTFPIIEKVFNKAFFYQSKDFITLPNAQREVDAARLWDHADRVAGGGDVGENLEEVVLEESLLSVRVDGGQAEHQDAGQE